MDVLILAGGRCDAELAEFSGVEFRCDLPFLGQPLWKIVFEATQKFGNPILVGGQPEYSSRRFEPGRSFVESMKIGLEQVQSEQFLLCTADLPCITSEAIEDFISRCKGNAGLFYPIIPVEDCEKEFPGIKRTTLRINEGHFTGGNIALIDRTLMTTSLPILEQAYQARKSPLKLASMLGFGMVFKLILGKLWPTTLKLPELEKGVGQFLGMPVKGIQTPFASIGADIDNLEQYKSLIDLKKS